METIYYFLRGLSFQGWIVFISISFILVLIWEVRKEMKNKNSRKYDMKNKNVKSKYEPYREGGVYFDKHGLPTIRGGFYYGVRLVEGVRSKC